MTDGSATVVLSLVEAAEQTATSKVDIWRAIREGALPAHKTSDGAYAVNSHDLFRVFERKRSESRLTPSKQAPECASVAKTDEAPQPAATKEIVVAFEALQAELQSLLRSPGKGAPSGEEKRQGEGCASEFDELPVRPPVDTDDGKAVVPGSRQLEMDQVTGSAESRRLWWRRL